MTDVVDPRPDNDFELMFSPNFERDLQDAFERSRRELKVGPDVPIEIPFRPGWACPQCGHKDEIRVSSRGGWGCSCGWIV